ncbi:MAG: hypothetical protein WC607_02050 [Candidatus Micrarchaeia archaeon]
MAGIAAERVVMAVLVVLVLALAFAFLEPQAMAGTEALNETIFHQGGFAVIVVDSNASPLEGVRVDYSIGDYFGGGETNASGAYYFDTEAGTVVGLRLAKEGYETEALAFIPTRDKITISLATAAVASQAGQPAEAIAVVTVTGASGAPVDGEVFVRDFNAGVFLGSARVEAGSAIIRGLPAGTEAYAVFVGDGVLDGSAEPRVLSEGANFLEISLSAEPVNTTLRAVDARGAPVPCLISVYSLPANPLASTETNGEAVYSSYSNESLYFVATGTGFAPVTSREFQPGGTVEVVARSTASSKKLLVTVDAGNASLSVRSADGKAKADAFALDGRAEFRLDAGEYSVSAYANGKRASASVTLDEDKNISLKLAWGKAFLVLDAVDSANNSIDRALFEVTQNNEKVSVDADGFELDAFEETIVRADADGYAATEFSVDGLEPGERAARSVELERADGTARVEFVGARDASGFVDAFEEGREYELVFNLVPAEGADEAGVALSVHGDAWITNYPKGDWVERSSAELDDAGEYCAALLQDSVAALNGGYKWVDSRSRAHAGERVFKVRAGGAGTVSFGYRGYSIKGSEWTRDPLDEALGNAERAPEKAGCYAATEDFTVQVSKPEEATGGNGTAWNSTGAHEDFWLESGALKSRVLEIELEVNSIYPADAVALDLTAEECGLAYRFESSAGTESCYGYANGAVWFKAADAGNPSCPLAVDGNAAPEDAGARLVVSASCLKDARLEIPISVTAVEEEALLVEPRGLTPGDGAAKLAFVLDEKQFGSRIVNGVEFDSPAVRAFELTESTAFESGSFSASVDYPQQVSLFPGKTDLGSRVESCGDWLCCSRGWCDASAAKEMMAAFKAEALRTANAGAFKRGAGAPAGALGFGEFEFVGIAQLAEGGLTALEEEGFTVEACGGPAVVELKAASADGSTWDYSASIMTAGGTRLCGFAHGEDDGVRVTEEATLASLAQAQETQSVVVPSFYSDVTGSRAACSLAVAPCAELSGMLVSLPALVPEPKTANFVCSPLPSGNCVAICEAKAGGVEEFVFNNRLYTVVRFGLSASCAPVPPALQDVFANAAPWEAFGLVNANAGAGASGVFDAAQGDPSTYAQSELTGIISGWVP